MKKAYYIIFLFLVSCNWATPSKRWGCMDPKAVNYLPEAEENDGNCHYGGEISIFRKSSNSGNKDSFWMMRDTFINGKAYSRYSAKMKYKELRDQSIDCFSKVLHTNVYIPLGKWKIFFLKTEYEKKDTILISDTFVFEVEHRSCFSVEIK